MKDLLLHTIKWISNNMAIPLWTVGHIHLSINTYQDIHETIVSIVLNILVLAGFIIQYIQERTPRT